MRGHVDRAYDVATYLRIDPTDGTGVRTRIIRRFRALLRRIERDYDEVVIVAHSQGTNAYRARDFVGWAVFQDPLGAGSATEGGAARGPSPRGPRRCAWWTCACAARATTRANGATAS